MRNVQRRPGRSRHIQVLGALVVAGLLVAPVNHAAAQEQQQQAAPGLTFEGDAGIILMQIKPDKVADFEQTMAKLHEAFAKTDKPERKQQAQGWKIYRSSDPGPGGNVLYVAVIEPALRGADYTVAKILYEVFPTEVQEIFPLYRDSFAAGLNGLNLNLVQDFGGPARSAGAPAPAGATAATGAEDGTTGTTGVDTTPEGSGTTPAAPPPPQR
jgi:hypothetical protein